MSRRLLPLLFGLVFALTAPDYERQREAHNYRKGRYHPAAPTHIHPSDVAGIALRDRADHGFPAWLPALTSGLQTGFMAVRATIVGGHCLPRRSWPVLF